MCMCVCVSVCVRGARAGIGGRAVDNEIVLTNVVNLYFKFQCVTNVQGHIFLGSGFWGVYVEEPGSKFRDEWFLTISIISHF